MCRGYHGQPVLSLFLIVFCDCDFVLGAQVISVHAEPLQRIRVKSQDFSMNTIFLIHLTPTQTLEIHTILFKYPSRHVSSKNFAKLAAFCLVQDQVHLPRKKKKEEKK